MGSVVPRAYEVLLQGMSFVQVRAWGQGVALPQSEHCLPTAEIPPFRYNCVKRLAVMQMHIVLFWVGVSGRRDRHSSWVLTHAAVNRKLKWMLEHVV